MDNKKIEQLLRWTDDSVHKLEELERAYKEERKKLAEAIASQVHQLAALSDSQALRAEVVRELYWNLKIPADIIGEKFGLGTHRLLRIAGPLTMSFPCVSGCGNIYYKSFKSRSALEDHMRDARSKRAKYNTHLFFCLPCQQKAQAEFEARTSRKREAMRIRDEQLRNMAWEEFIETKEWITYRNLYFHSAGYACELCQDSQVTLHIHLVKDAVQGHPSMSNNNFGCSLFCTNCKPKFSDLVNEEKGETVKVEFQDGIMDWYQNYRYSDQEDG